MRLLWMALSDIRAVLPASVASIVCVLVATLCGAMIGGEREAHDKAAGVRTMMLICLGSAVFTLASASFALGRSDPGRVAAQIVTGIGFLGAGAILREQGSVFGLTTAASIWSTAAVGMVAGSGQVAAAVGLSLAVVAILTFVRRLSVRLAGACQIAQVLVIYDADQGKTRVRIMAALDAARGPVALGPESAIAAGGPADDSEKECRQAPLEHCTVHKDHRAVLAAVAGIPAVRGLQARPRRG